MSKRKLILSLLMISLAVPATAGSREQAARLFSSLTGAKASREQLDVIEKKIKEGKEREIARDIIDSQNGINTKGMFYNVVLKNLVTPWTTEDGSALEPLNDMSATIIGQVRDEYDRTPDGKIVGPLRFGDLLHDNVVYKAEGQVATALRWESTKNCGSMTVCEDCDTPDNVAGRLKWIDTESSKWVCRLTELSNNDYKNARNSNKLYIPHLDLFIETNLIRHTNAHYAHIDRLGLDLSDPRVLKRRTQNVVLHQNDYEIAGILTTRAFGKAYMTDGTNRAPVAFSMKNFFCHEMEQLNDTTIPDYRNRRDVDRSPGGNSSTYKTYCIGCHAGMDAFAGAFAFYDFPDGALIYKHSRVTEKINKNAVFEDGYVVSDDSWINLWNTGKNASFDWGKTTEGYGVKSLGKMWGETDQLNHCMAKQVFEKVCFRQVQSDVEKKSVEELATFFKGSGQNMKRLFIETAVLCMGE